MTSHISMMAYLAAAEASKQSQEAVLIQLTNSSIEGLQLFSKTHAASMTAIAGSLTIYKALTLGSFAVSAVSFLSVANSRRGDDGIPFLVGIIAFSVGFIYACVWWDKSTQYAYHATWQQRALEIIDSKQLSKGV